MKTESITRVLVNIAAAVEEANKLSAYEIRLANNQGPWTVEFDIASSEALTKKGALNAIWGVINCGGSCKQKKSSEDSIKIRIYISSETKIEIEKRREEIRALHRECRGF